MSWLNGYLSVILGREIEARLTFYAFARHVESINVYRTKFPFETEKAKLGFQKGVFAANHLGEVWQMGNDLIHHGDIR